MTYGGVPEVRIAEQGLGQHHVIPDVLEPFVPKSGLDVWWGDEEHLNYGNEITPTRTCTPPTSITWETEPEVLYTLCLTDPDAPSRKHPTKREWLHWLIVNIPGNEVSKGDVLVDYIGSAPPQGSGLHRYVYVVYKQPHRLQTENDNDRKFMRIPKDIAAGRANFSIQKWSKEQGFHHPIAANFYQAQYDDTVPKIYATLKG